MFKSLVDPGLVGGPAEIRACFGDIVNAFALKKSHLLGLRGPRPQEPSPGSPRVWGTFSKVFGKIKVYCINCESLVHIIIWLRHSQTILDSKDIFICIIYVWRSGYLLNKYLYQRLDFPLFSSKIHLCLFKTVNSNCVIWNQTILILIPLIIIKT